MPYILTLIEEVPATTAANDGSPGDGIDRIEHLKLRLEGPLDIPNIVAVLTQKAPPSPKARVIRSDAGKPRKQVEPELL